MYEKSRIENTPEQEISHWKGMLLSGSKFASERTISARYRKDHRNLPKSSPSVSDAFLSLSSRKIKNAIKIQAREYQLKYKIENTK